MGKRIIPQRRGRGTSTYRAHSFRFAGKSSFNTYNKGEEITGEILDIVHSKGHSAPLMKIRYETGRETLLPAFEGCYIGQKITLDHKDEASNSEVKTGDIKTLKNIPEGTSIYNIELTPGDSGKLVKSGGAFAKVVLQMGKFTKIRLPSKKDKLLNSNCRAIIGEIGGSGRTDKPFLKAGNKFMAMKKKNKLYPRTSGVAMSAYDHPHGGTRSLRKGRPTIAPKNAPPGRKVGMIRPKHTGRNK